MFLKEADKEFDSKNGNYEGHHVTYQQQLCFFGSEATLRLIPVEQLLACCRKHSRHSKEEGKFSSEPSRETLLHTANDSSGTSAYARHHRKYLPETNDKSFLV